MRAAAAAAALALAAAVFAGERGAPAGGKAPDARERERAVAALQRRASAATPGTPDAQAVAGALRAIARGDLDAGEPGRAAELLGEAYALDEGNGLLVAELALAHLALGDAETARFYLRRAEQRVAYGPPEAFAALGDVYERLHRLDDAVAAWGEFVALGGQDAAVLARLRGAREELALARGQRSVDAGPIRIFADPAIGEDELAAAAEALESAYAAQSAFFGTELPGPQVAVLYAGRAYFSLVSVPDWVAGSFDGKIRISFEPGGGADARLILAHELAHAFIRAASGDRAPAWLHEGLAQWVEGRRMPLAALPEALGGRAPESSLAALSDRFAERRTRAEARANYAQALSLVEGLVRLRGEGAVACFVRALASARDLDEAMRAEAGMGQEELIQGWRKEIAGGR
jgi:tetratricopeptide (TPR) repeat protein